MASGTHDSGAGSGVKLQDLRQQIQAERRIDVHSAPALFAA